MQKNILEMMKAVFKGTGGKVIGIKEAVP